MMNDTLVVSTKSGDKDYRLINILFRTTSPIAHFHLHAGHLVLIFSIGVLLSNAFLSFLKAEYQLTEFSVDMLRELSDVFVLIGSAPDFIFSFTKTPKTSSVLHLLRCKTGQLIRRLAELRSCSLIMTRAIWETVEDIRACNDRNFNNNLLRNDNTQRKRYGDCKVMTTAEQRDEFVIKQYVPIISRPAKLQI